MCFGSKDDAPSEAPRPVAVSSAAAPANPRSSYSKTAPAAEPQYAAPSGPPPSSSHAAAAGSGSNGNAGGDYTPPSGPPPSHAVGSSSNGHAASDYAPPPGPPPSTSHGNTDYAPPAGPPPSASHGNTDYAPPSGPPPSAAHRSNDDYAPPSGPPPSAAHRSNDDYAPPAGPPPSSSTAAAGIALDGYAPPSGPPPGFGGSNSAPDAHDWRSVVPDTSLFPPPPALFDSWERSPANNATETEAAAGTAWCRQHPLNDHPLPLAQSDPTACEAIAAHNIGLLQPAGYQGQLQWVRPGHWTGHSNRDSRDSCLLGYPPLYAPSLHSPRVTGKPFTAYYEVYIREDSRADEISLAIGFAALPYPNFRLPGWHRGSLAVHGDDGHRYVNDIWGGKTFTDPFRRGDTYGLGMQFSPGRTSAGDIDVEVFFTRNGVEVGRWNLHEETDSVDDGGISGLSGFHDLSVAVGTFDAVSFEVLFEPSMWKYKGVRN